jgi:hypothetical protein
MRGHRGYNSYFESYTPPLMEDDSEETNLNELFVQETLDPRIESVMPILNKLHKKVAEMKEVNELSEWADSLLEAPGAETLSHNQSTEKSNLKAFDLEEEMDEGIRDNLKKAGMAAALGATVLGASPLAKGEPTPTAGGRAVAQYSNSDMQPGDSIWSPALRAAYDSLLFDSEEDMDEGLDANQKRVGQLGPTEKVKNNNIGKLVGANESTEIDPELARIIEMARFKR